MFLMDKAEMYQHGGKGLDWGRADPQASSNFIFLGRRRENGCRKLFPRIYIFSGPTLTAAVAVGSSAGPTTLVVFLLFLTTKDPFLRCLFFFLSLYFGFNRTKKVILPHYDTRRLPPPIPPSMRKREEERNTVLSGAGKEKKKMMMMTKVLFEQ